MPETTLECSQSNANIEPSTKVRRKPGRKAHDMGYGNRSGKAQKGIYLSAVGRDMVNQLSIITGKTDSNVCEDAIRDYWCKVKAQMAEANVSWERMLEAHKYVIPKWQR